MLDTYRGFHNFVLVWQCTIGDIRFSFKADLELTRLL